MSGIVGEKENNCVISVLMPVYNTPEAFLRKSIESILNQTFEKFEFIILNDASNDITVRILREYKDNRIRLIDNEYNMGLSGCLNKGISLAKGKYIARMDSDDIAHKKRLEWQYYFMKKNPNIFMCGGNIKLIDAWGKWKGTNRYCYNTESIRMDTLFTCPFAHPTVMFNARLLMQEKKRYCEGIKAEDYELWSRLVYKYEVANIKKVLLFYRVHDESITGKNHQILYESAATVQKNIFNSWGIEFPKTNDIILNGVENEIALQGVENAIIELIDRWPRVFVDKKTLRRRMDVVYRKTEIKMGVNLDKQQRFWNVFGDIYGVGRGSKSIDYWKYKVKDVAWKIVYRE